ncbi:cobalamin biosynthesis protein [uncultured Tateyamaria sp.]|uniref:cobalamin biosynthesis protein n=1 Tax=Tateyamaria sp. TaxID=1929288 RepID=UPI00261C3A33|nr:cobalamin biosynthesis protein [uncultured Tateyamaria sp.]
MIVAGFGFRSGASEASLADALSRAANGRVPTALATLTDKAPGLQEFARSRGLRLLPVTSEAAQTQTTLTRSEASQTHKSLGSVAEATALAAAGPNARLTGPRHISTDRMATCAIAIGDD